MIVNIYIETTIKGPGKRDGIGGYVLESEGGQTIELFKPLIGVSECEAALKVFKNALKRLTRPCDLFVWTECGYLARAFEEGWIDKWQQNGFCKADGSEISCKVDWQETLNLLGGRTCLFGVGEHHSFKSWMETECKKRDKRRVEQCTRNLENSIQQQS